MKNKKTLIVGFVFLTLVPLFCNYIAISLKSWAEVIGLPKRYILIGTIILSTISILFGLFKIFSSFHDYGNVLQWIKDSKEGYDKINTKLDEIALYNKYDADNLQVSVSDFDDFFVLMPLYFAKRVAKSQQLLIKTIRSGSDLGALENIYDDNKEDCIFAITDPSYLLEKKEFSDKLVFIAPIVRGVPLWLLQKRNNNKTDGIKHKLLTVSNDQNVFTGRVVKRNFDEEFFEIHTTVNNIFLNRILNIYKRDNFYKNSLIYCKETKFEYLLYSYSEEWNSKTKTDIRNVFLEFDFIFLTDPEITYLKNVILKEKGKLYYSETPKIGNVYINKTGSYDEHSLLKRFDNLIDANHAEKQVIFSAIIANKKKLENNPINSLRFLRCIQLGLLKTNIALTTEENNDNISVIFSQSFDQIEDIPKYNLYRQAFKNLKTKNFLIKEWNYPNDLIWPTSHHDTCDDLYETYKKFLLKEEDIIDKNTNAALNLIYNGVIC